MLVVLLKQPLVPLLSPERLAWHIGLPAHQAEHAQAQAKIEQGHLKVEERHVQPRKKQEQKDVALCDSFRNCGCNEALAAAAGAANAMYNIHVYSQPRLATLESQTKLVCIFQQFVSLNGKACCVL